MRETTSVANGTHTLTAKAYATSAAPNTATTPACTVTVNNPDTTPPTVSITSPANGSTVSAKTRITITATAGDIVGVTRVEFYVNNVLKVTATGSVGPYQYDWRVPSSRGRNYLLLLTARAYDAAGNAGASNKVTVTSR